MHYRIDDSELEIVAVFNGETIVLEMRLIVCEVTNNTRTNEEPNVEEPDLMVCSSDQSGDQISCSMTADLVSQSFPRCNFPFPQGGENITNELGKNEEPHVEEPESTDSSDYNACDQASNSSTAYLISPSYPLNVWPSETGDNPTQFIDADSDGEEPLSCLRRLILRTLVRSLSSTADLISPSYPLKVWLSETGDDSTQIIDVDSDDEEPESTDFSDNLGCDQSSSSSTADLASGRKGEMQTGSLCGDNAAQMIDESCMEAIIRVVNLTIRRVQPVENVLKYFQFILFDLNMGEQMYGRIYCHLHDQKVWWYNRKCDSELKIVGKLYGGFIVQGMRLNLPDQWKPSARMVLNHLENDDTQYLNFARSAFKQLNQDLPNKYSHLIKVC
ncbi:Hypothetical protein CINCED_3A000418 [Cinara cedri]|uniref:Uncharacterized protein n=1 Tax=Cinara cedri TaxID=506608 RepID=A0A5E4MSX8_9HEMI|nr:Hypothetical protein CINCED_3A000418 [Cinara cedri]